MDADLHVLLDLQGVTLELRRQREKHAAYARRLAEIERTRQALLREIAQLEQELKRLTTALRNGERELATIEEKIAHLRNRTGVVRTPKEAQALEHEMELLAQKKAALEIELLQQMEQQDKLERTISERRKQAEEKLAELHEERDRLTNLSRETAKLIATLEGDEPRLLGMLPEEVRGIYKRLLEKQVIPIVAAVTDGSCMGCLTTLPSALVNDLQTKGGVEFCPSCKRLIYHSSSPLQKHD